MATISEIILRNFKSFKSAKIPLVNGMVCIVGPNGSGKSNLTDAVRFAFGETSLRALRARKVQDLIYGGGEKAYIKMKLQGVINHPPNGAEGSAAAQVNAVDAKGNAIEMQETATAAAAQEQQTGTVEIIRAIRNDGKTLYRMNDKRTTRTAVTEFLRSENLDVGPHNVIAQGEVDRIVRMNAKERRGIIDEIAGVSEFEDKKRESLSELGRVEQRLNDASIVMKEKEGVLSELEKEKDTALKFLSLKDEQKQVKGTLVITQYKKVEKEFETILKKIIDTANQIAEVEKQIATLTQQVSEVEAKRKELNAKIMSKDTRNVYAEVEELRGKVAVDEGVRGEKETAIAKIDSEVATLESERSELNKKLSSLTGAKRAATERAAELKSRIEKLAEEREKIAKGWEEKRKNLTLFDTRLDEKRETQSKLQQELTKLSTQVEMTKPADTGKKSQLEKELKELTEQSVSIEAQLDQLFERERELNRSVQPLDSSILKMKEDMAALKVAGGIPPALTFVLSLKESGTVRGIHGTVADLYTCEKRYAVATEAAAGQRINNIVVDDVATATEIIKIMKEKGAGRATFIPLNVLAPDRKEKSEGTLGRVNDLIQIEPLYTNVFAYVFGNTHVVQNVDSFKRIKGTRLVSLEGDIAESSGVITGGTAVKRSLRDQLQASKSEKELTELKRKREQTITELYSINEQMSILRRNIANVEIRKKEREIELGSITMKGGTDIDDWKKSIVGKESDIQDLEREILDLQGEKERIRTAIANSEDEKEVSQFDNEVMQYKTELSAIGEKLKGEGGILLQERLNAINNSYSQLETEKKSINQDVERINSKIKQNKKQLEAKEEKIKEESKTLEKLYAEMKAHQEQADLMNVERGKFARKLERAREEQIRADAAKSATETRLSDLKVETSMYRDVTPLDMKREDLERRVIEIDGEMQQIGFANLKAPETYQEKLTEYNEIQSKVAVLTDEKAAVMKMIEEIDTKKRTVFMRTYELVNAHFKKMAYNIFKDEGALVLENEENPFEAGLQITMKVNNKKRIIEAMSGGEKSLLTIAFVFALHMYKPSRFYILDEVEAALDKENSKRFADLIKELSKDTQFIVVTHNDNVIPYADIALGVTKTKLGSKIVSIKLTNS
jgi:chromosome segregation protein